MSSRLGTRLLGFLLAGVILACGILTYLIVRRERAILLELNRNTSSLLAESITRNLREGMLEKDPAIVKRMLGSHSNLDGIEAAVLRNDGSLAYGGIAYEIPREMIASPKDTSIELGNSLVFLKPLLNKEECHQCHSSQDRIRGFVAVKISTEKLKREVDSTARHMVIFGFLTAFISGSALILVLRKMVLTPLTTIRDGSVMLRNGNLSHRIDMDRKDELGTLASSFNQMAEEIEHAQKGLEDAVNKKTKELRVIAELSTNVFRGDLNLKEIIERFLAPVTEELGYSFCALCLIDKETGLVQKEYERGTKDAFCSYEITLADDHPFSRILRETKPTIKRTGDIDVPLPADHLAIIPLTSHRKRRCKDINVCSYTHCPAFAHADERCWLIGDTLCRSPHSVKGKEKIFGCLHCEVFPLVGVLIAGSGQEIGKSSFHSLEILASEVESAIENYGLIDDKRKDIHNLIRLHDASVESVKSLYLKELTASIVSVAASFANADASLLWLAKDAKTLQLQGSSTGDTRLVPPALLIEDSFVGRSLVENRPLETINTTDIECLKELIEAHGFHYAASVPLKSKREIIGCLTLFKKNDFFMTDSEKAIITLFASQAASAITTSKIYEQLKDQKEFSDAIFNSAGSGVMVLDKEGAVIRINQSGSEILQLMPRHMNVCRITDLYPETCEMLRMSVGDTGKEVTITLKDERTRPIGFSNSLLLDKNGEEKGIIVVFRDLTEIKELQAEVRKKQHFVAMGKIISGVAHEVRNPLFAIQSITQILEREIESASQQALIKALLKETHRMKNLMEELLLYSRPSRLNLSDIDFETLLAEMKEYAGAKDREVHLLTSIPSPVTLKADRDKLVQVFLNLINNSLGAGTRTIRIDVGQSPDGVSISLKDDGIGIKREDMGKIFDPFFTTKREGTGLGLPICKKIVEDHGGTLDILSEGGKGTTALLTFRTQSGAAGIRPSSVSLPPCP
jgi:PAS domain S-box-containing protein